VKENSPANGEASATLDFERAAVYRDRLAALSPCSRNQGINPRSVDEADVFCRASAWRLFVCRSILLRTGQNTGQSRVFPRADRSLEPGEVLGRFSPVL